MKLLKKMMRQTRGFTIVEVMIAILIFSVGILAAATMQISAIKGNQIGIEVTQATFLAQDMLEQLKNSDDISTVADGSDVVGIYNRSWTLTAATGAARTATVDVSWTVNGKNHNVSLTTITRGDGS